MKTRLKKLLALALTGSILLGLLSVTSLAAETGEEIEHDHEITLIYHYMVEDTTLANGARELDTATKSSQTGPCTGTEHAIYESDIDPRSVKWTKDGWIGWGSTPDVGDKWPTFNFPKAWKYFPVDPDDRYTVHIYLFYETAKREFTLSYDTNGGDTGSWTDTFRSTADYCDASVTEKIPQWEGKDFLGWAAASDGGVAYRAGDRLRLTDDSVTLYAVWTEHVHVPETDPAQVPTCIENGLTEGSHCSVCGEILAAQEVIPARGHTVVTDAGREATCTEDGYTTGSHCSVCNEILTARRVIPASGHTVVTDAGREATCTGEGLTEGSHCSACGEILAAQEVIPAPGHDWNEEEFASDENGHWHACRREGCQAVKDNADHTWGEGETILPATCTEEGQETFTCTACGHTRQEILPAAGHSWDEGEETLAPTTSTPGVRTYTCTVCEATRLESIPRLSSGGGSGSGGSSGGESSSGGGGTTTPSQPEGNLPEEDLGEEDVPLAELPFPFEDVSEKDWFYNSVKYVYGKGLMTSVLKSRWLFGPGTDTSRSMVVTVLYRLDSADELSELKVPLAGEPVQFSDQAAIPAWANEAVAWAITNGVVNGYRDGTFGGDRSITRQELAAVLYRYAQGKGYDVTARAELSRFEDGDNVAKFAREAMSWAVGAGIIRGMSETRLDPAGTATRAQVAATLERFCEMMEAGKGQA